MNSGDQPRWKALTEDRSFLIFGVALLTLIEFHDISIFVKVLIRLNFLVFYNQKNEKILLLLMVK
mgnify:CR=1 FL=1